MKYCDQCGNALKENANFCAACGAQVVPDEQVPLHLCKKCGEPLENDASFCRNCGEPCCTLHAFEQSNAHDSSNANHSNTGRCIWGLLVMLAGGVMVTYGNGLNNSIEAQLNSLLSSGTIDPGAGWLIFGGITALLGLILLISSFLDN